MGGKIRNTLLTMYGWLEHKWLVESLVEPYMACGVLYVDLLWDTILQWRTDWDGTQGLIATGPSLGHDPLCWRTHWDRAQKSTLAFMLSIVMLLSTHNVIWCL